MKGYNTDSYKIIRNFLMLVFMIFCAVLLITGTMQAEDKALYQLEGTKYERLTANDVKNSCISLWDMIK